jgi:aryl-alcohol dehydrogenase-like predicted oxidoreductase
VLVFARSVLLQGVFALDPSTLPEYLSPARSALAELGRLAELARCDITALALLAVRDIPGIASLVMGVDCVEQVVANARAARMPSLDAALREAVMELGKNIPRDICNPSRWPVRS